MLVREIGQKLENVDRTHIVLGSGKLVLQKNTLSWHGRSIWVWRYSSPSSTHRCCSTEPRIDSESNELLVFKMSAATPSISSSQLVNRVTVSGRKKLVGMEASSNVRFDFGIVHHELKSERDVAVVRLQDLARETDLARKRSSRKQTSAISHQVVISAQK